MNVAIIIPPADTFFFFSVIVHALGALVVMADNYCEVDAHLHFALQKSCLRKTQEPIWKISSFFNESNMENYLLTSDWFEYTIAPSGENSMR